MKFDRLACLATLIALPYAAFGECCEPNVPPVDLDAHYQAATGLTGDELQSALNQIVKGHVACSCTPCVWEILEEVDEDPDNPSNVIELYTGCSIPIAERERGGDTPDA